MRLCCLCSSVPQTCNCARQLATLLLVAATLVLKAAIKSTKAKSHGNNVHVVLIAHITSADTQTNKHTEMYSNLRTNQAHAKHAAGW